MRATPGHNRRPARPEPTVKALSAYAAGERGGKTRLEPGHLGPDHRIAQHRGQRAQLPLGIRWVSRPAGVAKGSAQHVQRIGEQVGD